MTEHDVSNDLQKIKDYYSLIRKSNKFRVVSSDSHSASLANEYESILKTGPPIYLTLYKALYVEGKNQKALIEELGMPRSTISRKHLEMKKFLISRKQNH